MASRERSGSERHPRTDRRTGSGIRRVGGVGLALIAATAAPSMGCEQHRITADIVGPAEPPPISASAGQTATPKELIPIVGPLRLRAGPTGAVGAYDSRFLQNEQKWWQWYLANENDANAFTTAMHYGALRSRLMWAIRAGQPIGPAATSESQHIYARGRRTVRRYLQWSKQNAYNIPPHNSTGLPDIEALYVLDGDPEARDHIHVFAGFASYQRWANTGYVQLNGPRSDVRWIYEGMQAFAALHRIGVPHGAPAANRNASPDRALSSWQEEGEALIAVIEQGLAPDGSLRTASEGNRENLLFNAGLATELLKWDAFVAPNPTAVQLAHRIMAHILSVWESRNRQVLPYQYPGAQPAPDLAAYYVWPALVMWQETGDTRYQDLALVHLRGTSDAWIEGGVKQFNQTYSTGAQSAETLLSGIQWR